jgi:ELWxxDGT repeat protein
MRFTSLGHWWQSRARRQVLRRPQARRRCWPSPRLEALEDRLLPSLTPHLLKDINPGSASSTPPTNQQFVEVNGVAFFAANDGVHGVELWKSNGTGAGTLLVKDINPGGATSYPSLLTNVNGTLFFRANNGVNGYQLWKSNGSAAGTVMVKDMDRLLLEDSLSVGTRATESVERSPAVLEPKSQLDGSVVLWSQEPANDPLAPFKRV